MTYALLNNFVITDNPDALPATCLTCGGDKFSPDVRWFVDLQAYREFFGGLYLCNRCISQINVLVEQVEPPEKPKTSNKVRELERQRDELQFKLDTLNDIGIDVDSLIDNAVSNAVSHHPSGKRPSRSTGEVSSGTLFLVSGKNDSAESGDESGLDNLSKSFNFEPDSD